MFISYTHSDYSVCVSMISEKRHGFVLWFNNTSTKKTASLINVFANYADCVLGTWQSPIRTVCRPELFVAPLENVPSGVGFCWKIASVGMGRGGGIIQNRTSIPEFAGPALRCSDGFYSIIVVLDYDGKCKWGLSYRP